MTPENIAAIRASHALIRPRALEFAEVFYQQLFRSRPEARVLFPAELQQQGEKFAAMLDHLVGALDEGEAALDALFRAMGERHAGYGVCEDDYDHVGIALLASLRAMLGAAWIVEVEDAWATLYGRMAERMIAATD